MKEPETKTGRALLELGQAPLLESILGFALIAAVNFLWFGDRPGFIGVEPHPYWLVVLPIAARYGFPAGFQSGLLAAVFFLAMKKLAFSDFGFVDLALPETFGPPVLFVAVGVMVGEIREARKRRENSLDEEVGELTRKLEIVTRRYGVLNRAKEELDTRIISQEDTLSTLYESAQGLKSLREEEIYPAVFAILKDVVSAETASIYMVEKNTLVLRGFLGDGERAREADPAEGMMGRAIALNETISINTLTASEEFDVGDSGIVVSAALTGNRSRVLGVLNIEKLPFLKFNPHTVRMTGLIADWCGTAIENARTFKETKDRNIADDVTGTYTPGYLKARLEEEFTRARRYRYPLSVVVVRIHDFEELKEDARQDVLTVLSLIFKNKMRSDDLQFHHDDPSCFVLVMPSVRQANALVALKKIVDEINAFQFRAKEDESQVLIVSGTVADIEDSEGEYGGRPEDSLALLRRASEDVPCASG
jgi:polysaccharide biosynthesis protein PelD